MGKVPLELYHMPCQSGRRQIVCYFDGVYLNMYIYVRVYVPIGACKTYIMVLLLLGGLAK